MFFFPSVQYNSLISYFYFLYTLFSEYLLKKKNNKKFLFKSSPTEGEKSSGKILKRTKNNLQQINTRNENQYDAPENDSVEIFCVFCFL